MLALTFLCPQTDFDYFLTLTHLNACHFSNNHHIGLKMVFFESEVHIQIKKLWPCQKTAVLMKVQSVVIPVSYSYI